MDNNELILKELVIREFSEPNTIAFYKRKAFEGLWMGESEIINRYFTKKGATILDVGCGTGRTTIPLHKLGFQVTGVDLTEAMIQTAKEIATSENLDISYQIGDATALTFEDNSFEYILFSNQGWTQIPGKDNRLMALKEMRRVLKPDGILVFTAHPRSFNREFGLFWAWQWVRFYILKKIGFNIPEQDFGDRFFERKTEFTSRQFVHIPSVKEVKKLIQQSGLQELEINLELQISEKDIRKNPPVFYVCGK